MDEYASDKEQVEQLKKWWAENGKALLAGLVLGLSALFGYRYWDANEMALAESASLNYQHFLTVASAQQSAEAATAGQSIIDNYPRSPYATMAALLLAKFAVEDGDLDAATIRLKWVVEHAKKQEFQDLAQARMARILLAQNDAEGAWQVLGNIDSREDGDRFVELKADIRAQQGNIEQAKRLYLEALAHADDIGLDRALIEIKLDGVAAITATEPIEPVATTQGDP